MNRFDVDVLVFDLDGTLIDSREDIAFSLNHTFRAMGYDPLPMETISGFVGNGIIPLIKRAVEVAGHPEKEKDVTRHFRECYWEHLLDKTVLFAGVEETLAKLKSRFKMGLVSNKPERFTKKIVKELGLEPMFKGAVYGGDTLEVKKPNPSALLEIAAKYNSPTNRLLIVGDSAVDIETGKNAGAYTVGVTYGFRDVEELTAAGVDKLIDSFDELLDIL